MELIREKLELGKFIKIDKDQKNNGNTIQMVP